MDGVSRDPGLFGQLGLGQVPLEPQSAQAASQLVQDGVVCGEVSEAPVAKGGVLLLSCGGGRQRAQPAPQRPEGGAERSCHHR